MAGTWQVICPFPILVTKYLVKVGMVVSIAWTGGTTGLVFWVLDQYNMLRVEMEHEFKVNTITQLHESDRMTFRGWIC